jgi:D-alanyl-D-alanine dipeptidase
MDLQDISQAIPDAVIDLRYATTNNFTGHKIYKDQTARLRPDALEALIIVATKLRLKGYRLVVWDAYRPPAYQKVLRETVDDDHYVAKVSNHSRGITVDLSLAREDGSFIDMGGQYDDFSQISHQDAVGLNSQQIKNRQILADAMAIAGFQQLPYEWWHFDLKTAQPAAIIEEEEYAQV